MLRTRPDIVQQACSMQQAIRTAPIGCPMGAAAGGIRAVKLHKIRIQPRCCALREVEPHRLTGAAGGWWVQHTPLVLPVTLLLLNDTAAADFRDILRRNS